MAELGQAVGLDESLELEHGGGGHVQRQWDAHRRADDQRVLRRGQRLQRVERDAFLQLLDQLRTAAHRCNDQSDVIVGLINRSHRSATDQKGKGSQYSITERRVPELIPVLGSQPTGDASHKPRGRLPLLSARPAPRVGSGAV